MPGAGVVETGIFIAWGLTKLIGWAIGQDEKKAQAEKNIALADLDIAWIEKQTKKSEGDIRDEGEMVMGTQKAVVGHSAAVSTEGTPLFIQQETAAGIEENVLRMKEHGQHEIDRIEMEKENATAAQKAAFTSSAFDLAGSFLTGYTSLYRPKTKMPSFGHQNKSYYGHYNSPYGF